MNLLKKTTLTGLLILIMFSLAAVPALALDLTGEHLEKVRGEAQYGDTDLVATIGRIIKLVLGFIGLIALIIFIVGGFMWMSSGGDEEKIGSAKKLMSAAVVGLFIIILAYAITAFVISKLQGVTEEECKGDEVICVYAGTPASDPGQYRDCIDGKFSGSAKNCDVASPVTNRCVVGNKGTKPTVCNGGGSQ